MNTNDLFALARILAEVTRLGYIFTLTIRGKTIRNVTDSNFALYHWNKVLQSSLKKALENKEETDCKIEYDLVISREGSLMKKRCKLKWNQSIRRYEFSVQRSDSSREVKTFYSVNNNEAYEEIIKMVSSY